MIKINIEEKKKQKIYKIIFIILTILQLFTCLFCKGDILLSISVMIGSFVVIKIVEISISFIFTIPFITEDERKQMIKENPYSSRMILYRKSVKVKYTHAIVFSTALIFIPMGNMDIIYDFLFKSVQSYPISKMLFTSIFLGFGFGGLKAIIFKTIE